MTHYTVSGVTLLTTSAMIRDREPNLAMSFRGSGVILLFYSVYLLGFYRHMNNFNPTSSTGLVHPFACLLTAVAGLACGYRQILPDNPVMKKKLAILLAALLAVGMTMLLAALNVIPPGPDLKFFNFGWYRTFHLLEWVLSIFALGALVWIGTLVRFLCGCYRSHRIPECWCDGRRPGRDHAVL